MNSDPKLGFLWSSRRITRNILLPRYYDSGVEFRLKESVRKRKTVVLGDLIEDSHIQVSSGDEIGKMAYGTGSIPFVRTSDISNWEIRADPKQGVSKEIYDEYASSQDVQANDLLFVRDGTYLIGQACLVTEFDLPFLYQSHLLKFRMLPSSPVTPELLLASLSTPLVRAQIRSKQFTADIIDTIGNRYTELVLPLPKGPAESRRMTRLVRSMVRSRAQARETLRRMPDQAGSAHGDRSERERRPESTREREDDRLGFILPLSAVKHNVLVPRFYDREIAGVLGRLSPTHDLLAIGDLVEKGGLAMSTGVEVGKMAYGTGDIPFVRTSDLTNWELSSEPKQLIQESYAKRRGFAPDSLPGDILVVRDGTYLVGSNCVVTRFDKRFVFASGLYRLRPKGENRIDPYLLWALLNSTIVQKQFRAFQFTRDIIDTIGRRINDVVLPVPKDERTRLRIARSARSLIELRARLRNEAVELSKSLGGEAPAAVVS